MSDPNDELGQISRGDGYVEARLTRLIEHDERAVWAMLTEPAQLVQWLAPGTIEPRVALGKLPGISPPLYFASIGLGSNVSTCDGPPFKNRKITCLAFGVKCGALGASDPTSARASLPIRHASPTAPNPFPALRNASRLVISTSLIYKH